MKHHERVSTGLVDQLNIIVHNFTRGPTPASSVISESFVLGHGQSLLLQTTGNTEYWHTRQLTRPQLPTRPPGLVYAREPPRIEGTRQTNLKNWGAPADESEIFRLSDLPEFSSSNFTATFTRLPPRSPSPPDAILSAKKRKMEISSLHLLIPQPHFLPSPTHMSKRQPDIPPYKKSERLMIPPYKLPLDGLTEWDRCTWLIPIRGKLPWPESTSAVLPGSSQIIPIPPNPEFNKITWTPRAISQFWSFLLKIREAGTLGPLGLSFHPAPSHFDPEKSSKFKSTQMNTYIASTSVVSLSAVDHIKIYHDWPRSLHIRTIIDAWQFENDERKKIRLLVGAKLALLDDRSRGIMIL